MSPQTTCSADKAVLYMFISGARFFGWHGEATRTAPQTLIRMGSNTVVASLRRRSATDAASS